MGVINTDMRDYDFLCFIRLEVLYDTISIFPLLLHTFTVENADISLVTSI